MKKGFTLIELLAVILVLGVIALIATPIVLNVVDGAKESADENSAKLYAKAVNDKIAEKRLNKYKVEDGTYQILDDGDICLSWNENTCTELLGLKLSNNHPTSGTVDIKDGEVLAYSITINNQKYYDDDFIPCVDFENGVIKEYYSNYENNSNNRACPSDVVIPSKINGIQVTSIGSRAFENKSVTSVTIPSGVTSIGSDAFRRCFSLKSITLPSSLTTINSGAFMYSGLTSVTIPSGVTKISQLTFEYCNKLTNVVFEGSITEIGQNAFYGCSQLENITIPSSVTRIGNYSFMSTKLSSITIPANLVSIGKKAFYDCNNLTTVSFENPDNWYNTSDGTAWAGNNTTAIPTSELTNNAQAISHLKTGNMKK